MDWSDWAVWVAMGAIVVILILYRRIIRKNHRLIQLAEEAARLHREAEATEQRNRRLKQQMTSNIAHELKTPVASIRGYLEILLSDRQVDDERRKHFLERSYQQTLRLSDLIQDVSLINKMEESSDLFPKEEVDVCEVAQEAIDELCEKAAAAQVTISNRLTPMPLQGNRELLYGIFRNLMENSIAYAGQGVQVVLESYKDGPDQYYLHYYDNGQGVPDEYLTRLFDRFVRINEGRSRADGGTGLGLSIVKHAVLFHGGEIYAKNRQEGGLEYFFSLKK
ncbi:MAG: hypothetical protein J6I49_05085 [Bacteroidales bacterium]|nr:hypothetical protein [Bacteroidales bacterium]